MRSAEIYVHAGRTLLQENHDETSICRAEANRSLVVCFLCTGCGPSNEGALKGESKVVATKPGMENVNSYGDLLKYKMKEAKH